MRIKNIYGENCHLFAYLRFCDFAWLHLCALGAFGTFDTFGTFGSCKIFSQKKKKEFKTAVINSYTLLLKG